MAAVKVSIADNLVKAIVKWTFPDYRGRKVSVNASDRPVDVKSYWSGGSRSYFKVIDLHDLCRVMNVPENGTPFTDSTWMKWSQNGVTFPSGFAIVEHIIFCGKDCGITIHVNPADMPKLLPAA